MKIKSFKLDDYKKNLRIEETAFDNFNLLVGISGVGKTMILKAIQGVCRVAIGDYQALEGVNWKICFVQANQE
jgi:predicted ATP-binding protein involved in virulence